MANQKISAMTPAGPLQGDEMIPVVQAGDNFRSKPDDLLPFFARRSVVEINTQAMAYTLVLADMNRYVRMTAASAVTLTVPPNADVAFPIGTVIQIRQASAGQVTIAAGVGVTVATAETQKLRKVGSTAALIKVGADAWDLTGDLEAV